MSNKIGYRLDDDFQTITTDAVRAWMCTGDQPGNTFSLSVIVRSVADHNPVQASLHESIQAAVRKAVEDWFAQTSVLLSVEKI